MSLLEHFLEGLRRLTGFFLYFSLFKRLDRLSRLLFILKALYSAFGVNKLHLTGKKRMTSGTDFDPYLRHGCPGGKLIAAGAGYLGVGIPSWVNLRFHVTIIT